jgi:polyhydroxyalkanoate synthase
MLFDKYVGFLENMDSKEFVENFIRMEKWIFDAPAVPGETLRQLVKDLYQHNLLIESQMELGGVRLDLQRLTMPVLNIFARFDHLVPPEACQLLTQRVGSQDTEDICLDTGHIGIYVGAQFQKELVPRIASWLIERD